jgi:hypothetical protein
MESVVFGYELLLGGRQLGRDRYEPVSRVLLRDGVSRIEQHNQGLVVSCSSMVDQVVPINGWSLQRKWLFDTIWST